MSNSATRLATLILIVGLLRCYAQSNQIDPNKPGGAGKTSSPGIVRMDHDKPGGAEKTSPRGIGPIDPNKPGRSRSMAAPPPRVTSTERSNPLQRLEEAASVFQTIMSTPDGSIPQGLLGKAHCIVIVPGLKKGAFMIGAKYGKGYLSCRTQDSRWSPPGAVQAEGGSGGFQIGDAESDLIMLVMNERGANKLLSSKFTLGGEGEVAVGPVGRDATAQTDSLMRAEVLSWSRVQGVFAGVSLQGATLWQDLGDNAVIYGKQITNKEIVQSGIATPNAAEGLISLLNEYSSAKNR